MATLPQSYSIDKLLANGIQYFEDWDLEELASLGIAIGKKHYLDDPITLSADGILLDGHQRLHAMKSQGSKRINSSSVYIAKGVTATNALEKAIELNVRRRHLSLKQKAALARRLQAERGWSQGKVAQLFGVSRPAVNQWLNKTEPEEGEVVPTTITGEDGKQYPTSITQPVKEQEEAYEAEYEEVAKDQTPTQRMRSHNKTVNFWGMHGRGHKLLFTMNDMLDVEDLNTLNDIERKVLANEWEEMRQHLATAQARLSELRP
jgi:ParB-like chromosome segregation protein Spo0J